MTSTESPSIACLRVVPQLAEPLDRQLALFAPRGVHRVLEAVHRDLAEHRRDLILEVRREQREPLGRIGDRLEEAAERDGLAEHRRGLRERERRRLVEHALPAREVRVQAVAELVREREHVAAARRPVEQQVRVMRRHRVRAERARTLARARRRVDPGLSKNSRAVSASSPENDPYASSTSSFASAHPTSLSTSPTDAMRS